MKRFIVFASLVFIVFSSANARIIDVPDEYSTIQEGIDASSDGDTVLVQPNTYYENINFNGHSIVLGSLFLTTGDRDYISNTIIDGNRSGSVVDFRNSEDSNAVITGFTIQRGKSDEGGGISCRSHANPQIMDNIITNNQTNYLYSRGGGIYCGSSNAIIINNIIVDNTCGDYYSYTADGGGIYCFDANVAISDNTIINNNCLAEYRGAGGGIFISGGVNPEVRNNIVSENSVSSNLWRFGGGIDVGGSINFKLSENIILNNVADDGIGGGIFITRAEGEISNNRIIGNRSDRGEGGGIHCGTTDVIIANNIISGNSAFHGGAIHCSNAFPYIINNSIYNNPADFGESIYCLNGSNPKIINSILWGNSPEEIYFCENRDSNYVTIAHTDIIWGIESIRINNNGEVFWLDGNIDEDPWFVNPDSGDFQLQENSPCIDAGIQDTFFVYNDGLDTLYVPVIEYTGSAPDMGAFEYDMTGINDYSFVLPEKIRLSQNYPNPFNVSTQIQYYLHNRSSVQFDIYNIMGQHVQSLPQGEQQSGEHSVIWDASGFSSGIYLYKLTISSQTLTKRMLLLK
ncbi:MAG: T9SS type A sorting domain-containing protein [candidate division Zixibacteria bacterium]|nr:T9SS type A sorting domain-containing protein [candidate division Zixibacteria bacterium]